MRNSLSRLWACGVLLYLLAGTLPAQAADKWIDVESRNFRLVGNASESQIRRVAKELEEFRSAFATLFANAGQQSSTGTTVVIFRDDSAFKPYKPLYEGKPANIGGYFQPGSDVNYIAMTGDVQTPHTIYHEFVHSLTREATHRLPSWASEGLAEFYSTFEISGGKEIILGRALGEHVQTLREKQMIPVETLLAVGPDSPYYNESTKQGMFYAQSWALVHYLMAGNNGQRRPQFSKYLSLLAAGKSIDESFREAFQIDYTGMQAELADYVRLRITWPAFKITLSEKLDFERDTTVTALSEAQSNYYLGDMLLHIDRRDAAEKQLQKAIALDPSFGGSYASLGMLRLRETKSAEALELLSKAVQSDSQNPMAHYYYASLLQRLAEGENPDQRKARFIDMRAHLKKSIEIAPRYVEAYNLLGYVALVLREELSEMETALGKAITYAPGREELRLMLGQIMMSNNKVMAGRAILAALQSSTTDERLRLQASSLLETIASRLESEQAMREYQARRQAADSPIPAATETETTSPATTSDEPPTITRRQTSSTSAAPSVPVDNRPAGPQVDGTLTAIDCAGSGMTLVVRVGNATVKLHSATPSNIDFVSYLTAVKDSIGCGPVKPEAHVVITYKRSADPAFLGEPLRVEFRQ